MEALYHLSGFLIMAVIVVMVVGAIKPKVFSKFFKKFATRKYILLGGVLLLFVFGGISGATEPDSVKRARLEREQAAQQTKQLEQEQRAQQEEAARNAETTQEVAETQTIPFSEETTEDSSLAQGRARVVQEGEAGEKTITYVVTYRGGQEVSRTIKNETVTKEPSAKVTAVGTYVAPAPAAPAGNGYTNSQGNYVPSPSSDPAGASAQCRDGTYSYSQSRRGTCSHHGGVAQWL